MDSYIYLIIFFVVAGIIWRLVEAKVKGAFGERQVAAVLASLPRKEYRVIHNVMLPTERGTTQIDHVVVSVYGIFVIETKNYKGWITGGEHSEQWTKNMYGKKYKFYNPLRQNYGHIKSLQVLLNLPEYVYVSIVAFSNKATIKVDTTKDVINFSKIKRTICHYKVPVIDEQQLDTLVAVIQNANIESKDKRKEHVGKIKSNVRENKVLVKQGVCPRCGGNLVKRKGKYGSFWGCSNYPKCRFTKK